MQCVMSRIFGNSVQSFNNVVFKCTEIEKGKPIDLDVFEGTVVVDRPIRTIQSDID